MLIARSQSLNSGFGYVFENAADHKLFQGITTEIIRNDGSSPAPIGNYYKDDMQKIARQIGFTFNWTTLQEYFDLVEKIGLPINVGTHIGHNTIRYGFVSDFYHVSQQELTQMKTAIEQAMLTGALICKELNPCFFLQKDGGQVQKFFHFHYDFSIINIQYSIINCSSAALGINGKKVIEKGLKLDVKNGRIIKSTG